MSRLIYLNEDFITSQEARSVRILSEYIYPEVSLKKTGITDTVVMFGSARIPSPEERRDDDMGKYYLEAMEFAKLITEWGMNLQNRKLVITTGGGPGIMEAGNRGAKLANGKSLALNISLPFEQAVNPYADPELSFEFRYFFMRKLWFMHLCRGLIAFPGGFGTLDEIFEILTLIQTGKVERMPVVLYGTSFWKSLVHWDLLVEKGLIHKEDLEICSFADTPKAAFEIFRSQMVFP